jgi:hypothetical protein
MKHRDPDPNFKVITSHVRTTLYNQLKEDSERVGLTLSGYIKEAVIEKMNRGEKV